MPLLRREASTAGDVASETDVTGEPSARSPSQAAGLRPAAAAEAATRAAEVAGSEMPNWSARRWWTRRRSHAAAVSRTVSTYSAAERAGAPLTKTTDTGASYG